MGNSHKGRARDLSAHEADIDESQSSLVDSLAQLDTTQAGTVETGAVEETRALIHVVPDLVEEPAAAPVEETVVKAEEKKSEAPKEEVVKAEPTEKAVEPDGNKKPEKEVEKSPADLLAQLIEVVEGIDNMNTLEEFARDCKRQGLLIGGTTETGWWIKPLKDSANSKTLVEAIFKRKNEFIDKAQKEKNLTGQLRKIESITDIDELRKHVKTLAYFKHIKIGANNEPIADNQAYGSKEIVEALNKQRVKILAADDEKRGLQNLAEKYKK